MKAAIFNGKQNITVGERPDHIGRQTVIEPARRIPGRYDRSRKPTVESQSDGSGRRYLESATQRVWLAS